jgi:hypothetical protein
VTAPSPVALRRVIRQTPYAPDSIHYTP